jgi:hypothetical protein
MPVKVKLRDRAAGAIPRALVINFVDENEEPVDLTGFDPFVNIESIPVVSQTLGQGSIAITDFGEGEVTYIWDEDDSQAVADYTMLVWVDDDSTQRYESPLIEYRVFDGPGPTPTF